MPVPTPRKDEEKGDFESRCISFLIDEGKEQDQAVAICLQKWRDHKAAVTGGHTISSVRPLTYLAALHSVATGLEKHVATFYIMNTSKNRNRWAVTDKALEDALASLIGKPLGLGEDYKVGHFADVTDVGKFIEVEKPDGYALAKAEITDAVAWEALAAGQWGPISVVIDSYEEVCSLCGENLTGIADPWNQHEHVANNQAHVVVNSFVFKRVDFVKDAAYPQAAILNFGAQAEAVVPLTLLAGYYQGSTSNRYAALSEEELKAKIKAVQDRLDELYDEPDPDIELLWMEKRALEEALIDRIRARINASRSTRGGAAGSPGAIPNPEELRKRVLMSEDIEALKRTLAELQTKLAEANDPEKNLAIKAIQSELDGIKAARHKEVLEAAAKARLEAGLCTELDAEIEALKDLTDEVLVRMTEDAIKVKAMVETKPAAGPQTLYSDDGKTAFETSVETMREAMLGYRRDADGKVLH